MNIYDLLNGKKHLKPFSEAPNEPDDFGDFIPDGAEQDPFSMDNGGNMDMGMDMDGGGFDDMGMGDMGDMGMGDPNDPNNQQQVKAAILNFIENLDEGEIPFTEKLLTSFGNLYADRKKDYERMLVENLDATEFGEQASKVRDQYKLTLDILREYILNKCIKDTTHARATAFLDFKQTFENLNNTLNDILLNIQN